MRALVRTLEISCAAAARAPLRQALLPTLAAAAANAQFANLPDATAHPPTPPPRAPIVIATGGRCLPVANRLPPTVANRRRDAM